MAMTASLTSIRYSFCIPRILSRTSSAFFSFSNAMKTRSLIVSRRARGFGGASLSGLCDVLASARRAIPTVEGPIHVRAEQRRLDPAREGRFGVAPVPGPFGSDPRLSVPRADDRPPKAAVGQLKADDLIVEVDGVHHLIGRIVADRKNNQPILRHVTARLAQVGFGDPPMRVAEAVALDVVLRILVDQRRVENDEVEILLIDFLE